MRQRKSERQGEGERAREANSCRMPGRCLDDDSHGQNRTVQLRYQDADGKGHNQEAPGGVKEKKPTAAAEGNDAAYAPAGAIN